MERVIPVSMEVVAGRVCQVVEKCERVIIRHVTAVR